MGSNMNEDMLIEELEKERDKLQGEIEDKDNTIIELHAEINSLNAAFSELENKLNDNQKEVEEIAYNLGRLDWSV